MEVTNIKLHTYLKKEICSHCGENCMDRYLKKLSTVPASKKSSSFIVVRAQNSLVFTCFFSGYVNLTGIKDFESAELALTELCNILDKSIDCFSVPVIDSISSRWNKESWPIDKFPLRKIQESAKEEENYIYSWDQREQFPALFLKTSFGTLLWFVTPSVVAVGSRSGQDIGRLTEIVRSILKRLT
jgi:TATA-box binding protein (TBP) (component of TFIID and TFIIIB)